MQRELRNLHGGMEKNGFVCAKTKGEITEKWLTRAVSSGRLLPPVIKIPKYLYRRGVGNRNFQWMIGLKFTQICEYVSYVVSCTV
jgi:hypothetical protein